MENINTDGIDSSLYETSDHFQVVQKVSEIASQLIDKQRKDMNYHLLYISTINLIKIAQNSSEHFRRNCFSTIDKLRFVKIYSTVKVCTSRCSGHTSVIAKIIKDDFNKVIVVFPNLEMGHIFIKNFAEPFGIRDKVIIVSPNCLKSLDGLSGVEAVISDCSSFLSKAKTDEIYEKTIPMMTSPLYVFME